MQLGGPIWRCQHSSSLGQCIDGPTTHFTSLVTLGYLGIIPNLAMGTIWAVSLFCAEKNGGSNHFEPWFFIAIVGWNGWNSNLLLFQFSSSFQSGQKIWSWRPKGCCKPQKKPRVATVSSWITSAYSRSSCCKQLISFKYIYLIWTPLIHSGMIMIQINSDVMLCYAVLCYVMLCYVIITMTTSRTNRKRLKIHMGETKTAILVLILITVIIIIIIIIIMDSCDVLPSIISGPTHLGLQIHKKTSFFAHLRTIRTPNTYVSPHQNSEPASPRLDCCCMRMAILL